MSETLTVNNHGKDAWTGNAIQDAVDRLAATGGGRVDIPAGTYLLQNAIRLRSHVCLVGEIGTVLKKAASVSSPIPDYLGYGHYEITVAEPDRFRVGMGIHVLDDNSMGFYTTVATITGISGDRLFLDRMLNHDYAPAAHARAVTVHPLVAAEMVTDAAVERMVLDGNSGEEACAINGCRGAGAYLYQSRRVVLQDLEIRNFRGDAVSFQQDVDITVRRCHVHHNTGGGVHPGSGSVRYLIEANRIHDNGGCGVFYCLRTTHSLCRNNLIEANGQAGISIGERDTDHVITHNTVRGHGGPAIVFRPPVRQSGDRVRLADNTISGNARTHGAAEIEVAGNLHQLHMDGNRIETGKAAAISLGPGCCGIFASGNAVNSRPLAASDIIGQADAVALSVPQAFPDIGPLALPADGARHLGIADTGPCALPLAAGCAPA